MTVPDQVAVMPLPNAILFPRVLLPLYIFEPRYRQMLDESLKGERMFVVSLTPANDATLPSPVAGIGVIRTSVLRPDGTSNLILEGVARVQIMEYIQLEPYRIARVEELASLETAPAPSREELIAMVQRFVKARAKLGTDLPKGVLNSMLAVEETGHLADLVGYTLLDDCRQKQHLLETLDVTARLDQLIVLLQRQVRQFELWKTLQGNLPNDDVGRN